ncbi:MAG: glycoside hydrolase family 125 protein, partial [Kiritimatiellia bacterium]
MTALEVVRGRIAGIEEKLGGVPGLRKVFHDCFLNTLETTVQAQPGDTFVITGDIHAMWLRDSTAQVLHYLRFADAEPVAELVEGLIARQAKCVLIDPYANAYNREPSDFKPFDDRPRASDWVWERKYEIDSLCYPVWLAWRFHEKTGRTGFLTEQFAEMLRTIVDVF